MAPSPAHFHQAQLPTGSGSQSPLRSWKNLHLRLPSGLVDTLGSLHGVEGVWGRNTGQECWEGGGSWSCREGATWRGASPQRRQGGRGLRIATLGSWCVGPSVSPCLVPTPALRLPAILCMHLVPPPGHLCLKLELP